MGFISKTVKSLIDISLRSFYRFDVFSLPSKAFNPINQSKLSKSRYRHMHKNKEKGRQDAYPTIIFGDVLSITL
jgi:hypothetical protein